MQFSAKVVVNAIHCKRGFECNLQLNVVVNAFQR